MALQRLCLQVAVLLNVKSKSRDGCTFARTVEEQGSRHRCIVHETPRLATPRTCWCRDARVSTGRLRPGCPDPNGRENETGADLGDSTEPREPASPSSLVPMVLNSPGGFAGYG